MSEKKEIKKNGSILQPLTVYACFMGKWNTEMMSESKIDPYSCIVVRGPKNFLQVYLCEKKWGVIGTLMLGT